MAKTHKEAVKDRFAVMRTGRFEREVKAWQYYSVFDFCRMAGYDREQSEEIAKWCRDQAKAGDVREWTDLTVRIVEKEVVM